MFDKIDSGVKNNINQNKNSTVFIKKKTFKEKPKWLRVKLPSGEKFTNLRKLVDKHKLHTICESGNCPNMGECWGSGTATFMILGNTCTRSCGFCAVATGRPNPIDWSEPERVARSVKLMQIKHCVITSVDRDDLEDGGVSVWIETIKAIRRLSPKTTLETLIPDFKGDYKQIQKIANIHPEIVSHNLETVERLTKKVRIQARYDRSLMVLDTLKKCGVKRTKSGLMLGLGETKKEVIKCMKDMRRIDIDILTLGQYLQPTKKHLPVIQFITPKQFNDFQKIGLDLGFKYVESGPLVRSSYHAEKHLF